MGSGQAGAVHIAGMNDDKTHPEQMTAKQRHGAASAEAALADVALAKFDDPTALQHFLKDRADNTATEDEGRQQFADARAAAVQRKEEALLQYGESLIAWVNADDEEEEL